jgi:MFS family permease
MVFLAISYGATLTTFLAYCINIPIIKTVWDLDLTDLSFIFSFIAIGGFIGILLGKYVSDTYGRKSAIFVGSLIHSLFGISASFASSIQGFSILSFGSILGASFGF